MTLVVQRERFYSVWLKNEQVPPYTTCRPSAETPSIQEPAVSQGIEITLEILGKSLNVAAHDTLVAALDVPQRNIQEGAVRALLRRRGSAGPKELVKRWNTLSGRWRSIAATKAMRFNDAVTSAIIANDPFLTPNGCEAAVSLREYNLLPTLTLLAERHDGSLNDLAAQTLIALADTLYNELASPRDYRNRTDPQMVRQNVLVSLEQSVARFSVHRRLEILDSFLMLASQENAVLRKTLQNPFDAVYLHVVESLTHSPRPGIMRLLFNYLASEKPPLAALNAIGNRRDVAFLRLFLRRMDSERSPTELANLKRLEKISWLLESVDVLQTLNDSEQGKLIELLTITGVNRNELFDVLVQILKRGGTASRRAAAHALRDFRGTDANDVIRAALDDSDPIVQANLLVQLRERNMPNVLNLLLDAVESPHPELRKAAQESLTEFSFSRYLSAFDKIEEDARRTTGAMVKKIDPKAISSLKDELTSESRTRRLRALEMTEYMDVIEDVQEEVIALMQDHDHFLRVQVIFLLSNCSNDRSHEALELAKQDEHDAVREAAEDALQLLAAGGRRAVTAALAAEEGSNGSFAEEEPLEEEFAP